MYKTNSVSLTDRDIVVMRVALADQRKEFIRMWLYSYKSSSDLATYWARRIQEINDSDATIYKF